MHDSIYLHVGILLKCHSRCFFFFFFKYCLNYGEVELLLDQEGQVWSMQSKKFLRVFYKTANHIVFSLHHGMDNCINFMMANSLLTFSRG